jgi:CspA family cold shock protein
MPTGTVKFFNPTKGFGFIAPEDGSPDVFVHVSAVERSGLQELNDGDQVSFELEQDRKSGKLAAVDLEVLGSSPAQRQAAPSFQPPSRRGPSPDRGRPTGSVSGSGRGVVKWFNPTKGFGFIQPSDGGGDVFVHVSAVERAGLRGLNDGQAISYEIEEDRRSGKTSAVNLRID